QDTLALVAAPKKRSGAQGIVLVISESGAVEAVRAGLSDDGDGRASRHALLRVKIVGGDVDLLNGFGWRDVNGMMRQPDEHVHGAVHPSVVVVAVCAVDVGAQGPLRSVGDGILKHPWGCAGNQVDQRLVIPILVERHVYDCRRVELRMNVRLFRLEDGRRGFHRNLLAYISNWQLR